MTDPTKWTKIDPAVHTPEWFKGKGVTILWRGKYGTEFIPMVACEPNDFDFPRATHFLLHPPLPDSIEEEIEWKWSQYAGTLSIESREWLIVIKAAYIAGAKAFLGRGK